MDFTPVVAQTDPLVVGVITALLSGSLVGAVASMRRARSGSQLDVLNAAKVLYDEQRAELTALRRELDACSDDVRRLEGERSALAERLGEVSFRLADAIRHLEERETEIDRLRARIAAGPS